MPLRQQQPLVPDHQIAAPTRCVVSSANKPEYTANSSHLYPTARSLPQPGVSAPTLANKRTGPAQDPSFSTAHSGAQQAHLRSSPAWPAHLLHRGSPVTGGATARGRDAGPNKPTARRHSESPTRPEPPCTAGSMRRQLLACDAAEPWSAATGRAPRCVGQPQLAAPELAGGQSWTGRPRRESAASGYQQHA